MRPRTVVPPPLTYLGANQEVTMSIIAKLFRRQRRPVVEIRSGAERAANRARIEALLREIAEPGPLAGRAGR